MTFTSSLIGINEVPGVTLANNTDTPLVAADVGKPIVMNSANAQDAILASDGEIFPALLGGIEKDANFITALDNGYHEVTASSGGDAPDPTAAVPCVVANGSGGVKKSASMTNAIVLKYDSSTNKAVIKIL